MQRLPNPFVLLAMLALCAGCSVFEPPLGDTQGGPDGAIGGDGAVSEDGSANDDGGMDAAAPSCVVPSIVSVDDCAGPVVINEVDGSGDDFIEIHNRGTVPVNISGYVITDGTDDTPSVAEGVVVPAGTVLDPGRHLYVWANLTSPQEGLRTDCIPGAPPPCMHSSWGISAGGEMVYLLDNTLQIACKFEYPGAVFGNEAFGRVSDGATTLCPTDPTPGEANEPSSFR